MIRRALLALGLLAFVAGLFAVVEPSTALLGRRSLVTAVGVLALFQGYRVLRARWLGEVNQARTPDPELPPRTPVPGDGFDRQLRTSAAAQTRGAEQTRRRLRGRIRNLAARVVASAEGVTYEQARERVREGTWTDDAGAAAFLRADDAWTGSIRSRVPFLRSRSAFAAGLGATVDELTRRAGLRVPDGDERRSADEHPGTPDGGRVTAGEEHREGVRETGRWRGVSAVVMAGVGGGILARRPALLLLGVVGLGVATYARTTRTPEVDLAVERTVLDERPRPGDDVEVRVTVRNEGESMLPDLRLVDGVPDALAVSEGSPRRAVSLRPGKRVTFAYAVAARRGVHEFGPLRVLARDVAGSFERDATVAADSKLVCRPAHRPLPADALPLSATRYAGRLAAREEGAGTEFATVREYRPGDPPGRIDWNRRARTGELSTVAFRDERDATVVLLLDARENAYRAPVGEYEHSVDRAVEAAGRTLATLDERSYRVGLTTLGPDPPWLDPSYGGEHAARARALFTTHPAFGVRPPEGRYGPVASQRRLRERLVPGAEVVFFTPLCDDYSALVARRLREHGHPITVVSPDPTDGATVGQRLLRVERADRVTSLREDGVRVADWGRDTDLVEVLVRDLAGRSR